MQDWVLLQGNNIKFISCNIINTPDPISILLLVPDNAVLNLITYLPPVNSTESAASNALKLIPSAANLVNVLVLEYHAYL